MKKDGLENKNFLSYIDDKNKQQEEPIRILLNKFKQMTREISQKRGDVKKRE